MSERHAIMALEHKSLLDPALALVLVTLVWFGLASQREESASDTGFAFKFVDHRLVSFSLVLSIHFKRQISLPKYTVSKNKQRQELCVFVCVCVCVCIHICVCVYVCL